MSKHKSQWLKEYESIAPSTRKDLGITKLNFRAEYIQELRAIRRSKKK